MSKTLRSLNALSATAPLLRKGNPSIERYCEDTMMRGEPDVVLLARDLQDIQEALRICSAQKIPVTFCGSQISMTGASVAQGGLLISTEKLEKILDVGRAQPGITITEFKKNFAQEGLFYPPAPTSQDDVRLGATVSTNATGEDLFQYGTTRKYIRELKEMMAFVYKTGKELGLPFMTYAHIGKGHPHVNYLCKTAEEKKKAHQTLLKCCRKAVGLGGGVAGEHGIGKLHRDLVGIQWPKEKIAWMKRIKQEWDPNWILGRGNIIEKS